MSHGLRIVCMTAASVAVCSGTVSIAPGVDMPQINFGICNRSRVVEFGGRGLDTAWWYGDADQREAGEAIRKSGLERSELFVTTKIPCCPTQFRHNKVCEQRLDGVHTGFSYSLADKHIQHDFDMLGLDYIDLLLMHWPCTNFEHTVAVYGRMEALLRSGKVRAIGVSNFNATALQALVERVSVKPAVNQVSFSIGGHSILESKDGSDDVTLAKAQELGVQLEAWSPLGGVSGVNVLHNPTVLQVARAHQRTTAQVALRWLLQNGIVVVTESNKATHIQGDLEVFDFELSVREMALLSDVGPSHVIYQ